MYSLVREAYLSGLESLHATGADLTKTTSVASFFVSRVDTAVDKAIAEGNLLSDEYKGIYGSMSFSPLGFFSGWVDYHYYDKGLDLNDLGYLLRDNYTKRKIGLKFQSFEPWNLIRNISVILEGDKATCGHKATYGDPLDHVTWQGGDTGPYKGPGSPYWEG